MPTRKPTPTPKPKKGLLGSARNSLGGRQRRLDELEDEAMGTKPKKK
jgi:hypothetical protein